MIVPPPTLIVDTREVLPWPATIRRGGRIVSLPVVRAKLCVGDYSIMGFESEIAFERKSLQDWVGTMFGAKTDALGERASSWDRFCREVVRAKAGVLPTDGSAPTLPLRCFQVVIEGSREMVEAHAYRSQVSPRSVLHRSGSLAALGIPVQWMGNRDAAAAFVMGELIRWWARRWTEKGAAASDLAAALDAAERSAAPVPPIPVSKPWRGAPLGGMPTDTSLGRRMKQEARRAAGR